MTKNTMTETERQLRILLAAYAGDISMYRDDVEMNDASAFPHIDFMRDHPTDITLKLIDRNLKRMQPTKSEEWIEP
jgi:hypothetical protein